MIRTVPVRWTATASALVLLACGADDRASSPASAGGDGDLAVADGSRFDAVIDEATALYRRAEFDSAMAMVKPALAEARASVDSVAMARLLALQAYVAYQRSDYEKARETGEETLAIELAVDLSAELARAYNLLGLVAWQQSRFSDAIELFTKTGGAAGDEAAGRTLAAINLGNVHTDLGNLAEARRAFQTGLELSRAGGDERREAIALNNLGMLSIRVGDPLTAIPLLEQAIGLFREQGADNFEANALGQIGTAYTALGDIGKAITVLDEALQLARAKGLRQEEASNLEALAEAYRTAGDHRRALALYREAEAINGETGLVWEMASDQRSRAQIYVELGELGGALEAGKQALETHRSVGARWEELADLLLLADLNHELGEGEAWRRFLDEARALASEFDTHASRVQLALTEARIAERAGNARQALVALDGIETDLSSDAYDWIWTAEVLRARVYRALGDFDAAVAAGRRAVRAVERTRAGFGSGFLRNRITADRRDAYETLVRIHLEMGDTAAAFEVSDAARGRTLLDYLTIPRGTTSELPEAARLERVELLQRIGEWNRAIEYLETYPPEDRDEAALAQLRGRISRARAEYEALRVLAIERDTTGAALLGERTASLAEVQGALKRHEAILEYLVGAEGLVGFVVTRDVVLSFENPIPEEDLRRRVRIARGLISNRDWDTDLRSEALRGLFDVLLAPAKDVIRDARRLVVVPDGVLNYLPFAALITPSERYVVEDYMSLTVPSASALSALRGRGAVRRVAGGWSAPVAFAPLSGSLPATEREVEALRRTLSDSRTIVGSKATEARLREALSARAIVHVATHGVMNTRNPMFSRIELASSQDGLANDGRLEVHELFTMQVRSLLVFLSGCETGLGAAGSTTFASGHDYATLSQAFLYAGAENVISTLWRIEDEGAAAFAETFYVEVAKAASPVEALAVAQRQMIASDTYGAPYYWAAYQLAGEGEGTSYRSRSR